VSNVLVRMFAIRLADHSERSAFLCRARNLASIGTVHVGTAASAVQRAKPAEFGKASRTVRFYWSKRAKPAEFGKASRTVRFHWSKRAKPAEFGKASRTLRFYWSKRAKPAEFGKASRTMRFYWSKRAKLGRVLEGFPYPVILLVQTSEAGRVREGHGFSRAVNRLKERL
jgi:hypothetical protein